MRMSVQRQGKLGEQLATIQKQQVWLPKPSELPFSSGLTQPSWSHLSTSPEMEILRVLVSPVLLALGG